jgi:predicted TIM-barrel fold metal-dependent hydrolase
MLSDPAMREGIRRLGQRNLSFDALVYHEQLAELLALARAVPHTMIVLNHYGCPIGVGPYAGRERETFAAWRRDIRALSECENIKVKLGGLGMIITGAQYHLQVNPPTSEQLANDWHPWIETCVEAFGTGRCMFESNFPVDKAMYSYGVLWNAFKRITGALSIHERSDLFFRTAAITYRLKEI